MKKIEILATLCYARGSNGIDVALASSSLDDLLRIDMRGESVRDRLIECKKRYSSGLFSDNFDYRQSVGVIMDYLTIRGKNRTKRGTIVPMPPVPRFF